MLQEGCGCAGVQSRVLQAPQGGLGESSREQAPQRNLCRTFCQTKQSILAILLAGCILLISIVVSCVKTRHAPPVRGAVWAINGRLGAVLMKAPTLPGGPCPGVGSPSAAQGTNIA